MQPRTAQIDKNELKNWMESLEGETISVEQIIEEIEEQLDRRLVDEALAEQGDDPYIPLSKVKEDLGL
jgi:NADPH-dependent 7-cyano-7-deazaguanine reductase QueF